MNAALAQFLINNNNRNTKKWNLLSVRKLLAHPPYFFSQGQQVHVELKTTVKPCSSFAAHHKNSNLHHEKGSVPRALQFSPLLGQCRCGMNRAEMLDRVNHAVELSLTRNPVQYINTSSRRIEEVSIKWLHLRADFSGSLGTRMTSWLITTSFWGSSLFAACMEGGVSVKSVKPYWTGRAFEHVLTFKVPI